MFSVDTLPYAEDMREKLRKSQMPVTLDELKQMPSPRYIKSHLPLSLLPPSLVDTAKVKVDSNKIFNRKLWFAYMSETDIAALIKYCHENQQET